MIKGSGTTTNSARTLTIWTNGTVSLDNGSLMLANTNAELYCIGGVLKGTGSLRCYFQNMGGYVRPGGTNQAGALSFTGTYYNAYTNSSAGGTLEMELGGTNTVQFDRLVVSGSLVATGTLSVALINGFKPNDGDRFKILDFSSASVFGTFDTLTLPGGARRWDTSALYDTGEIRYVLPSGIIVLVH